MKIEYLAYLVDFYETRSVSATAGRFYLSNQGMNRALHQLEKESGHILFENDGGSLRFTPAGVEFAEHARGLVNDYQKLQTSMRAFASRRTTPTESPVRMLATPAVTRYVIPMVDVQRPNLFPFDVLLREEPLSICVESLATTASSRSFGLVSIPATEKFLSLMDEHRKSGLLFEPIAESDVIALVSSSSPISKRSEFDVVRDLPGATCGYLHDEMLLDFIDDFVREQDILTITSNLRILEDLLMHNRIITFMVKMYLATTRIPEGIVAMPCAQAPSVMFGFLGTQEEMENPDIRKVVTFIRERLAESVDDTRYRHLYRMV